MEHRSLESSYLESTGYDPAVMLLEIKFKNGKTYRYQGVPQEIFEQMCAADSCGKFFGQHIKGKFPGVELAQKKEE